MTKEPFDRQELFRVLEEQYKGLSLASYKLKMQRLLESGENARVGRNYERHPFLEYRIFELVQMNEFLNHQIAHNADFVFIEAEYPGVLEQAFQKYVIDESQMFRYAKRRHIKDDILKIIQSQTT
ncbi:MAG: hypothetical protein HFG42_04600, partial [Lachnospiraceae bacterium]|nr:hypothetical protein [Lachnospiraceae bacterium]